LPAYSSAGGDVLQYPSEDLLSVVGPQRPERDLAVGAHQVAGIRFGIELPVQLAVDVSTATSQGSWSRCFSSRAKASFSSVVVGCG
jgi:hypothetical protein